MSRTRLLYASLGVLLLTVSAAWAQSAPLLDQPSELGLRGGPGGDQPTWAAGCRPVTLDKGPISGFGYQDPDFTGADLVIRTPEEWQAFWNEHTSLLDPPPPVPPVDFQRLVVIAVVQGRQSTGGGPNIAVLHLVPPGDRIVVFDDERPGQLDVITNPYHIVLVGRHCLRPDPVFDHIAPQAGSAVLSGRVGAALPDQEPQPLPGARVTLRPADASGPPRVTYSGLDGSYFFVNVPPGAYAVRAEKPGLQPVQELVVLPEDGRVQRDFVLIPPPPPPPGRVFGHVARPAEGGPQPVPGATVTLARPNGPIVATQTGPDGAYEFTPVLPGEYVLRVTKEGFHPAVAQVTVAPGAEVQKDFLLQPVSSGQGGVLAGVVRGVMPNGDVQPLPGAVVRVRLPNGTVRSATTNPQGQYAIPNLPAGTYTAVATKSGFRPAEVTVAIVAGQTTQCDFVLQPIMPPAVGHLTGLVQTPGPDGELVPVRGARVRVTLPDGQFRESLTNAQGRYAITGLPVGTFPARASKPGFLPAEAEVTIAAGATTEQDFVLSPAPQLTIAPSAAAGDEVVAGPPVTLR